MGKLSVQTFVYKINSNRLAKAKWNLTLPLDEARRNDEVVALASSQVVRWIDQLNGISGRDKEVISLKKQLKSVKKLPNSFENRKRISEIYNKLDELQFHPDYLIIAFDKVSHLRRAAKGFTLNGQRFVRLVATPGQVKTMCATYISERLAPEIKSRIENGRNPDIELVPAKLEAYRALTCSSSTPIHPFPRIAVVHDCITNFKEDTIFLDDADSYEPTMEFIKDADLELVESDGYGLISVEAAKEWSEALGLSYVPGGFNTRCAWEKGVVFCFDFRRFSDEVAHTRIITDVWGDQCDLSEIDVILCESQLKLWSSYDNIQHYVECCKENGYDFAVTKIVPEKLDDWRATNYQFLEPIEFSDADIEELIAPSVDLIKNIISQNSYYATIFLHGEGIGEQDIESLPDDFMKGLLIDGRLQHDSYVMNRLYNLVRKKIRDLSIGSVDVPGNFALLGGDPYSLMQHIHGMEVTGLLKPHEIYSSYWREKNVKEVVCFRAPMSTAENIVKMHVSDSEEAADWFSHIKNVTLMSSFSGEAHSLNGADM